MKITSLLYVLAAVGFASAATIHTPPKTVAASEIATNTYFAVLKSEAGTPGAQRDQARFQEQVKALGIQLKPRHAFTELVNAVSFELDASDIQKVAGIDAVKEVFPMLTHTPPRLIKQDVNNPALKFSHGITGVQQVHDQLKLSGKGIKVGIIDTGVDYHHPGLGGCFGKGCRVTHGHDFVGDAYDENTSPIPVPDEDPDDCGGHGTHVAGIVGAKDKDFVGVAPEVTFGAYRVFGCKGSTSTDIIIAAMERAFKDGMDVINLSLGGGSSWAGYPSSVAATKLSEKGMVVVSAMGNDGDKGLWEASSPAMSSKGFGVASFDNSRYMAYGFKVDNSKAEFDYAASDEKLTLDFKGVEIVSGTNASNDEACEPITADVKGKLVLIKRGNCVFTVKAKNAEDAGAIGVLVYNHSFGGFAPGAEGSKIPLVGITNTSGESLRQLLAAGKVTLSFDKERKAFDNPTGGKVSSFSSWGPGPELELKPDVGAPGGLILSTWPLELGGYITISGTSMATPYTAGSVALYLQKFGKKNPVEIRDAFKITGQPTTELGTNDLTPAFRQGGGLIQVNNALLATTRVNPTMLPILSSDVKTGKLQPITITNTGKYTQRYTITHKPALAVQAWDHSTGELLGKPIYKKIAVNAEIATKEITLRPGQSDKVNIFFNAPSNLSTEERWLLSGYIFVTPKPTSEDVQNGFTKSQPALSIPYGGMHGDYKKVSILTKPESGLPALFSPSTGKPSAAGDVFSLKDKDVPQVIVRLVHPTRHMIVKVLSSTGAELGTIVGGDQEFTGRNDNTPTNLATPVVFNGKYIKKDSKDAETVADGKYKLKVQVLRPFGKEANAADWQTWTSPEFVVDSTKTTTVEGDVTKALESFVRSRIGKPSTINTDASVLPQPFHIPVTKE